MAEERLKDWQRLFARAMRVLDAAQDAGLTAAAWSFGGGAALMRRLRHRRSAGVDIFLRAVPVPGCLPPRLVEAVGALSVDYAEEPGALKLYFPEGEVAFVACALLTPHAVRWEAIQGRHVLVETPAEILAKKLWHRAAGFTARDLLDFAAVATFEPEALSAVAGILQIRRGALLERLREHEAGLREDFAALHALEFRPSYEECVKALHIALARSSPPRRVEQERAGYVLPRIPVALGS